LGDLKEFPSRILGFLQNPILFDQPFRRRRIDQALDDGLKERWRKPPAFVLSGVGGADGIQRIQES
jgi:hypothetical protein